MGRQILTTFDTLIDGDSALHILTPEDSCKDRLAAFIYWNDRSGLDQAIAVAREHGPKIDLGAIDRWAAIEGGVRQMREFRRVLLQLP